MQHIPPPAVKIHIDSREGTCLPPTTEQLMASKSTDSKPGMAEAGENSEIGSWTNILITEKLC